MAEGAPEAEPFTKDCLTAALQQCKSKSATVRKAAAATSLSICTKASPFSMKSFLPAIFAQLPVEKSWQIREQALLCLEAMTTVAPKQMGNALPEVVPEITACMWDTKKQVKAASTEAMKSACMLLETKILST